VFMVNLKCCPNIFVIFGERKMDLGFRFKGLGFTGLGFKG
jgi:hypothetical protein